MDVLSVLLALATGCNDKTNQPVARKGPYMEVPEEGTNIQAYLSEAGLEMGQLEARGEGQASVAVYAPLSADGFAVF